MRQSTQQTRLRPAGAALGAALAVVASLPVSITAIVALLLIMGGVAGCVLRVRTKDYS